jgi:putative transposase
MPRKSRIDAPGALHHVIARGIEGSRIFRSREDRIDFLARLSALVVETGTRCLAWALIPNHFHVLLKTGAVPVSRVMSRVLTGYAVAFNRRHHRSGHLFQNRYKSVLCQEDSYLLELVRYIHLNPLRAGLVENMDALDRYAYCGHSVIMGNRRHEWQDTATVLSFFSGTRELYRRFVEEGIELGKRGDLIGGGLIRSMDGWANVKGGQPFQKSDERILGDGAFVEEALALAHEELERRWRLKSEGVDLEKITERVCEMMNIGKQELSTPGKDRRRVQARSLLCYLAVRKLGISQVELSRLLRISPAAVTFSVRRGEKLAGNE